MIMRCCGVVWSFSSPQKCTSHLGFGLETTEAWVKDLEQQLASARDERNSLASQIEETHKERQEHTNRMEQFQRERAEQESRHQDAMADLGAREKRMTMMAVGMRALATAAGVAAIIMAVI